MLTQSLSKGDFERVLKAQNRKIHPEPVEGGILLESKSAKLITDNSQVI